MEKHGKLFEKEARKLGTVNVAASTKSDHYARLPSQSELKLTRGAAYVHMTSNNTIEGTEYTQLPAVGDAPLVSDTTSDMFSRPIDVSRHGLIYAGAQKNIGPAGLVIIVVREDLLGHAMEGTPTVLDYKVQAEADSMSNTPASYAWYIAGLVFQWLKRIGGINEMARINAEKARLLYAAIDGSDGFYRNPVDPACRSQMNVPFTLRDAALDAEFLAGAKEAGLLALKGHKSVGGMRASIYSAMPLDGVRALVAYMDAFAKSRA